MCAWRCRIFDPKVGVGCPQGCAAEVTEAAEHENKAIKARPRRAEAVKAGGHKGLAVKAVVATRAVP